MKTMCSPLERYSQKRMRVEIEKNMFISWTIFEFLAKKSENDQIQNILIKFKKDLN